MAKTNAEVIEILEAKYVRLAQALCDAYTHMVRADSPDHGILEARGIRQDILVELASRTSHSARMPPNLMPLKTFIREAKEGKFEDVWLEYMSRDDLHGG